MRNVLRLGLTGGIGSGKSTVARLLGSLGANVIDADAISKACTAAGGSAMQAIENAFGSEFVTSEGALNRERMRALAFEDPHARARLESILHPLIADEIRRQALALPSRCLVYDVPLLVESTRWRPQLDRVVVVDCTPETQIRRVQARNHWDRSTIEGVIKSQSSRQRRLAAADVVVFNDGNEMEHLRALVTNLGIRFGL